MAAYSRLEVRANRRNQPGRIVEGNADRGRNEPNQYGLQRSFADVLKTGVNILVGKAVHAIQADEEGHSWLYDSILSKFKAEFFVQCVKSVLKEKGPGHVLVRNGGGRVVVMSFLSIDDMMSNLAWIKAWFQDCCEFVKVWEPVVCAEQERCLWLRCYGVPLNIWNRGTFNKIGSRWGSVISLDENIGQPKSFTYGRVRIATGCMEFINNTMNLECKGRLHPVLVCEEQQHDLVDNGSILFSEVEEDRSSNEVEKSDKKEVGYGDLIVDNKAVEVRDGEVQLANASDMALGKRLDMTGISHQVDTVVEETQGGVRYNLVVEMRMETAVAGAA
ncbi:hypothetical protein CsSME_00027627 [Camellia sinensis var. sinensis]